MRKQYHNNNGGAKMTFNHKDKGGVIMMDLLARGGYLDETNWGAWVGGFSLMMDLDGVRLAGDTLRASALRLAQGGTFSVYREDMANDLNRWGVSTDGVDDISELYCEVVADYIVNFITEFVRKGRRIQIWEQFSAD